MFGEVGESMNATLKLPIHSEEQLKHLQRARDELNKNSITFDTGYDLIKNTFDWELDWSLKGALLSKEKELVFNQQKIEAFKYIMNAEDELRQAGVYFDAMLNSDDRIVWLFKNLYGAKLVIRSETR